jgi:hypothetical protein
MFSVFIDLRLMRGDRQEGGWGETRHLRCYAFGYVWGIHFVRPTACCLGIPYVFRSQGLSSCNVAIVDLAYHQILKKFFFKDALGITLERKRVKIKKTIPTRRPETEWFFFFGDKCLQIVKNMPVED